MIDVCRPYKMEQRKTLVIGPRTRKDILEGKHIRKDEDGGDVFDDYWTDSSSDESSRFDESKARNAESSLKARNVESPIKTRSVTSPLKTRNVESPIKTRSVTSPLKTRNVESSIKTRSVASPLKTRNVKSPLNSRSVGSPLITKNVESLIKTRNAQSPLKTGNARSPLKTRNARSPLRTRNAQSPLKSRNDQSPIKSKVLFNNTFNANEHVSEIQDITANLGMDDENPDKETFNQTSNEIAKNNSSPKSSSITPVVIEKTQNANMSSLSSTCNENEMPRLVSRISVKPSKKSISRATKKDPKIREVQLQFDELDEKIMQMVHVNDDNDMLDSGASEEEMSLTNESSTRSIERNTRSFSQSTNDSESVYSSNISIKNGDYIDQKNKKKSVVGQGKDLQSQCIGGNTLNSTNTSQSKKKFSETFISKKNFPNNQTYSNEVLTISHKDGSHIASEQGTQTVEIQTEKLIGEKTVPKPYLNTLANSFENTNDNVMSEIDSSSKSKQKENNNAPETNSPFYEHSSNAIMSESSLSGSHNPNSHFEKSKQLETDTVSRLTTVSSNVEDISGSALNNISDKDNTSNVCMMDKQSVTNKKNIKSDKNVRDAASSSLIQTVKSKNKKHISTPQGNDCIENNEVNFKNAKEKQNKIKINKRKSVITKKAAIVSDEDIVDTAANSDSISQNSNRQTAGNSPKVVENCDADIFLNSSTNSTVNKTYKKQKKSSNRRSQKIKKKSEVLPEKVNDKIADLNSPSHLPTLSERSGKNEKNSSFQKTATNKRNSSMLCDENSAEAFILNDSSRRSSTKKQKTSVNETNNIVPQENYLTDALINSPKDPHNKIDKNTSNKQKRNKRSHLRHENNADNKNQTKAQGNKISKSKMRKDNLDKENQVSDLAAIRRSCRKRYAPLAHWRNEHLQWRFENGQITDVELNKGTKEDTAFLKSLNNMVQRRKKKKVLKPKKATILDAKENKKKRVHLLKKFPLVAWDSPVRARTEDNPQFEFLIKRMLETKKNSFGYIYIDVGKTKPPQYMPEEDLQLTLIEGDVQIKIQNDLFILENKDMFIVPRGAAYSVTNIGKRRAILSYAVGKFKFLEGL